MAASKALSARDDAELVALGAEYQQVSLANRDVLAEMEGPYQKWIEELQRRKLDWKTQLPEICALEDEVELRPFLDRNAAYCDRMSEIEKRILEIVPTTKAGFAAKARIILAVMPDEYSDDVPHCDQDWDAVLLRNLISDMQKQVTASA